MIYKKCNTCSELKLLCEFGKDRHMRDGHSYVCRMCNQKKTEKWRKENRERSNNYHREYYQNNPERLERRRATIRAYRKAKYYTDITSARAKQNAYHKDNAAKTREWSRRSRKNNYTKILARNAGRRASKVSATPLWLSDTHRAQIQWFYAAARMMTQTTGVLHHVDHIHPLQGFGFSGLHVPWNLRVIPAAKNIFKGNKPPEDERPLFWEAA